MKIRAFCSWMLAVGLLLVVACGGDDGPSTVPASPTVTGISSTSIAPGDTVTITGTNFAAAANDNQVQFTNSLAIDRAFEASSTQLRVVVGQNATDGAFTVITPAGSASGPSVTVERNIGDFFVFGGTGTANTLTMPNPTATTRYLVIPHGTNPSAPYATDYGYEIRTQNLAAVASSSVERATTVAAAGAEAFEAWRWEQAEELILRHGIPTAPHSRARREQAVAAPFRQFYVLNTTRNPATYDQITADLRYNGTKCLIYADVDTLSDAADNLAQSQFQELGQAFDSSISTINETYFADYSDIDGNGKVILVISPVVNGMSLTLDCGLLPSPCGFIAGFFNPSDLFPTSQVSTSNYGEVLYLLAADPDGQWGYNQAVDFVAEENIGTTAHELQHLISASHRLFVEHGPLQATWLEEGMAHMAEDLNGIDRANKARAALYMGDPGGVSLEHALAPLNQRGGIYLFLRLMADRYGTEILHGIVQSKNTGRACVEDVTGEGFYELFAEFLATLYLNDRGITADPRFNYSSIDLSDYGTVHVYPGLVGVESAGEVYRSSGDLHLYNGTLGVDTEFTFIPHFPGVRLRSAVVRVQ